VTVDRPFLYALRDRETGAALFLGRVASPAEQPTLPPAARGAAAVGHGPSRDSAAPARLSRSGGGLFDHTKQPHSRSRVSVRIAPSRLKSG
jgi:hypothetical protein